MSAGVDFIDFSAVPAHVVVCSNGGAFGEPIAEHVFAMILYFGRNLVRNHGLVRGGTLDHPADGMFLRGKTIGIIGTGGIGQSVARAAKGFDMRTMGINTSGRPVENFDAVWGMDHLDDLLKQSDVVVIALPLNLKTRHLITAQRLGLMKEDCILVNVARGGIISQDALYAHLKAHPPVQGRHRRVVEVPTEGRELLTRLPRSSTSRTSSPRPTTQTPCQRPWGWGRNTRSRT